MHVGKRYLEVKNKVYTKRMRLRKKGHASLLEEKSITEKMSSQDDHLPLHLYLPSSSTPHSRWSSPYALPLSHLLIFAISFIANL